MSKINDIRTELWRLVNCPYEIRRVHTKIKELLQELDQYIEESFDIEEDVDSTNSRIPKRKRRDIPPYRYHMPGGENRCTS